jgi:hypothetical protein
MARIFPTEITAAAVASLLAALGGTAPRTNDGWKSAFFDFDAHDLSIAVKLDGRAFDASARRAVEEAVTVLPHFQAWVVALYGPDGRNDGSDDHSLGMLKVNGDRVDLFYCAISYNSTWEVSFRKGCAGLWYPYGENRPLPELPAPHRYIGPAWLAWNDGTVRQIAQAISAGRRFEQMPILADALEDAGCRDADILAHCRGPADHGRGCWLLDLLARKG